MALFCQAQNALELPYALLEDLTGGGVARIELLEEDLFVLGNTYPEQLPARGVAFSGEISLC